MRYIDPIRSEDPERFDLYGLVLAGIGLGGIAFGLSVAGLNLLPWTVVIALVAIGTISMTLYVIHARRTASPVLDFALLRLPTMRASIIGGFLFRLGIGALPFLLPLLMQVGFGLSPFHSGLVTFASAAGAMGMKTLAARIIRTFGFRNIMTVNAVVSSIFLAACALFTITTPLLLIVIMLVVGGFFRSLQFTAINTLAYAEVEPAQMSRATTLVSVNQQLAVSAGVAVGAVLGGIHHVDAPRHRTQRRRFRARPFIVVSIISTIVGVFLLADACRCRPRGLRPRGDRGPQSGARRRSRKRPPPPKPPTRAISGWADRTTTYKFVMPGLVPGIHVFLTAKQDVDGRDEPGHDEIGSVLCFQSIAWNAPKSRRHHVALGRILAARGRLDVLDGRKVMLELRHQRRVRAALKHLGDEGPAR